jgi:hypothetical protein
MITTISSPYLREFLCKLREDAVYDPIAFGECDLIRSHYLNHTARNLEQVYKRRRQIVRRAPNVLLT